MSTEIFIALINPAMALVFAAAFAMLWRHERQRRYIAVLAGAYLCLALGFLLQYFTPLGLVSRLLSNAFFLAGGSSLALSALGRYGRPAPVAAILLYAGGALAAFSYFLMIQPDLNWRIYVINFALGAIALTLAAELRRVPARKPIDNLLLGIVLVWGISFFPRPIVAMLLEGPYDDYENLHQTFYWISLNFSAALFLLLFALTMITGIAVDVMDQLRHESQTDPLSRLLNRRGFEEGAVALLHQARRKGMPATLVVCDLDHFKAINDGYGHGCGDGVIIAFADCLRRCVGAGHLVGRIGGEEFAILLLGADISTGRLFAEGARTAFSCAAIAGVPEGLRCTASFGVAQQRDEEGVAALFIRADHALYQAKEAGRDCVRVAVDRFDDQQPLGLRGLGLVAGS